MKKLSVLILVLILISVLTLNNEKLAQLCFEFENAKLEFYCKGYSDEIKKLDSDVSIINNGEEFIVKTMANNAENIKNYLTDCFGYCIKIEGAKQDIEHLLDKIQVAKTEIVDGIEILYGYMYGFLFSTFIDGKKVNVQIAFNDNTVTIGSPIILGSY
ncbi:MAG: hypothetical protein PHH71_02455 [Clostridia bacterium]|nr:hypothetical protein [Clostridia bacterium]MDD4408658.1 hypothetical protein [Clostridia bacterium]